MKAIIIAAAIGAMLAGTASAQMMDGSTQSQSAFATLLTDSEPSVGTEPIGQMPPVTMKPVVITTAKVDIGKTVQEIAAKMMAESAEGSTDLLRSGKPLDLIATLGPGPNPMEQQSVNVHVTYDARPVGGILNIRVELVPVFGGIGAAVRPTISREFAQAVDDFDDDFISSTITKLTDELATQLAVKD